MPAQVPLLGQVPVLGFEASRPFQAVEFGPRPARCRLGENRLGFEHDNPL